MKDKDEEGSEARENLGEEIPKEANVGRQIIHLTRQTRRFNISN